MVHGLSWLRSVLDCGSARDLASLGITMSAQEQQSSSVPSHQDNEQEKETNTEYVMDIPDSWQLSPQQRAFIDLFDEEEQKK